MYRMKTVIEKVSTFHLTMMMRFIHFSPELPPPLGRLVLVSCCGGPAGPDKEEEDTEENNHHQDMRCDLVVRI